MGRVQKARPILIAAIFKVLQTKPYFESGCTNPTYLRIFISV